MKLFDVVRLLKNQNGIASGSEGTIVYIYDEEDCEVEFFDKDGNTIDVFTVPFQDLELIQSV